MSEHAAVLLMCGGLGTRMRPWSDRRHKCLVGTEDATLFRGHLRGVARFGFPVYAKVPAAWLPEFKSEAVAAGVRVRWIPEDGEPDGSGSKLLELAENKRHYNWWVIYGDTWFSQAWYARMGTQASVRNACASVAAEPVPDRKEDWRGVMLCQKVYGHAMVVRAIDERPTRRPDPELSAFHAGMSVYPREFFGAVRTAPAAWRSRKDLDLFGDVVPYALAHGHEVWPVRVRVSPAPGKDSADVGTPERYAEHVMRRYHALFGLEMPSGAAAAALSVLRARRVYVCGNGGACCVAAHAALDWAKAGQACVEAVNDAAAITAWSNDNAFVTAFANLLARRMISSGDTVVLLSTSGNSPNVLAAARLAKDRGADVVGVTCSSDNELRNEATHPVVVNRGAPSKTWGYGPLEDAMSAWMHGVTCVMEGLAPWPGR